MNNVILMFILMFISFAGYGMYLRFKFNIETAVIPIFLFSSIVLITYIGGLLNILEYIVYLLFSIGIVLFVYCLVKIYFNRNLNYGVSSPSLIFFLTLTGFLAFLLNDFHFIHHDNFSHWGLVVKEMVVENQLPDDSTVIKFRNYPPGTALFVYYVVTLIGFSESAALIAQGILISGTLATLFVFSSWRKPLVSILPIIALSLSLLWIDGEMIQSLLVDSFLGYISVAALVIGYYYRDHWKYMSIITMPVLSLILLTKDSGKIFFAFGLIWLVALLIRNFKQQAIHLTDKFFYTLQACLYIIAIPSFINFLWGRYTAQAYAASYKSNKHAVTADKFSTDNLSSEFVNSVQSQLLDNTFNLGSHVFQAMIWANIFAIISILIIGWLSRQFSNKIFLTLLYVNSFYIVYIGLLYVLYLFLMPQPEAVRLAGFPRYQTTASIFFIGTLMMVVLKEWMDYSASQKLSGKTKGFIVISMYTLLFPFIGQAQAFVNTDYSRMEQRLAAASYHQQLKIHKKITPKDELTVINAIGKPDHHYLHNIMKYERLSLNTNVFTHCQNKAKQKKIASALKSSKYLIVIKASDNMERCISQNMRVPHLKKGIYQLNDGTITKKLNLN